MIKKITTISLLFLLSSPSFAADEHDHGSHQKKDQQFYGHLDIKVHADRIVSAEEADEKFDEYYSHSHLELGMRVNSKISINSNIKIEGEPAAMRRVMVKEQVQKLPTVIRFLLNTHF